MQSGELMRTGLIGKKYDIVALAVGWIEPVGTASHELSFLRDPLQELLGIGEQFPRAGDIGNVG